MAAVKGQPKTPGSGRKKGGLNKSTKAAKEALEMAFDGIGGVPALIEWARDNQTEFYKLFTKLLPVQVEGNLDGKIEITWQK